MGNRDNIVPVETEKDFSRRAEIDDGPRSVRETMESFSDELELDMDESSSQIAHQDEPEDTRERDESGKFKSKNRSQDFEAHTSGEDRATEAHNQQATEFAAQGTPVLAPPGWAADAKELFNQLPPRLQQEVYKRETDHRRGLQQATDKAAQVSQEWAEVEQAFGPYNDQFARAGVSRGAVVNQLMAWQRHLDNSETRAQAFNQLAQSYGTSLAELAQVSAAQPSQEPPYVREIRQQNQQLAQMFQRQQQALQQNQQQSVVSDIQAFAQETDASGQMLRPYIDHVADDMITFIPGIKASNPGLSPKQLLQAAYEKAVWVNPSTRELELRKAAPQANTQNLEKARRAAKLVNGEARGPEVHEAPRDIRGAMAKAAEKLGI